MSEVEYWYRLEDRFYAPMLDEWERPIGEGEVDIAVIKLRVLRHTPKGAWVTDDVFLWDDIAKYPEHTLNKRFVLRDARKRYACPTMKEAIESYVARKQRQRSIYSNRINSIDRLLALVPKLEEKYLHENQG